MNGRDSDEELQRGLDHVVEDGGAPCMSPSGKPMKKAHVGRKPVVVQMKEGESTVDFLRRTELGFGRPPRRCSKEGGKR